MRTAPSGREGGPSWLCFAVLRREGLTPQPMGLSRLTLSVCLGAPRIMSRMDVDVLMPCDGDMAIPIQGGSRYNVSTLFACNGRIAFYPYFA